MKFLFYLSKRTLFHKRSDLFVPFIRVLAIVGLIIGTIAMTITLGILKGFENDLVDQITNYEAHIRLESYKRHLELEPKYADKILSHPEVISMIPYSELECMLRYKEETEGIIIECMSEREFIDMLYRNKEDIEGKVDFREKEELHGLYLGQGVAEYLNVHEGDTLTALFMDGIPTPLNPMPSFNLIVTGIFSTGMKEFDANYAYAPMNFANKVNGNEKEISGYQIILKDPLNADEVSQWINKESDYHYIPTTWRERNLMLFRWLETQKAPIVITFGIIALVALVNIISTLVMIVLVKERDTAILKSMGMKPKDIRKKFMIDGFSISAMGLTAGILIAKILEWGQMKFGWIRLSDDVYFVDKLPIEISWGVVLTIVGVGLLIAFIATFFPARNAAKIKPVEVLRYE